MVEPEVSERQRKAANKAWRTINKEKQQRQEIKDLIDETKVRGYEIFEGKDTTCIVIKTKK